MHMADALISPAVGGVMWAATAGITVLSAGKLKEELDDRKVPLMGVLGAFIFAAQMINFTIPATGSSGHLGGGMILAILLGPHAAFLTMASVLAVQALFFADGGLLALGCNVFNLGFLPCFVAYPLIYKNLAGEQPSRGRIMAASVVSAVAGLQFGASAVVLQTWFSGISELPLSTFLLLMQPIHLAIGIVEGFVTATVVTFVWKTRPEVLQTAVVEPRAGRDLSLRPLIIGFLAVTVITGGILSWFASTHPDGLEWAMLHTAGKEELESPAGGVHEALGSLQEKVAILPDYGFKSEHEEESNAGGESGPRVKTGTSVSGLVGGTFTMVMAILIGLALKRRAGRGSGGSI